MVKMGRFGACLFAAACMGIGLRADTLVLTNGKTLEGVIEGETEAAIHLNMGMGSIQVARDRIERVDRDGADGNAAREAEWKTRYIKPRDLPEDLRSLWKPFEGLTAARDAALKAAGDLTRDRRRLATLERKFIALRNQSRVMQADIARRKIGRDVVDYNARVERYNEEVANANRTQAQLEALRQRQQSHHQRISAYSSSLSKFESDFDKVTPDYEQAAANAVERVWLDRTGARLIAFHADFRRMEIPVSARRGVTEVSVAINNRDEAPFLLDTGASLVTLTERLARKCDVEYDTDHVMKMQMADGSISEGHPAILTSVAVGEARLENVPAVVMETPPGPDIEGLLGMTFLKEFEIFFDGSERKLILTRLNAR